MYSLQPALYELSFSQSDDQPNLQQQQNLSQTPKKHKALPAKSHNTPLKCSVRTLQAPHSNKIWSIAECERIIANYTSPVGKFLRGMNTTAAQAVALNLMPYLMEAPSKPRVKYGQRRSQTKEERTQLAKERNREHARRTRRRRSVFKKVTEACRFLTPLPYLQHGVNDEDDDSSDSDNDNENDFDDNKHSSESICNTASDSTTGEYSDTCDPSDQLHSLPPLFTANAYQSISGRYSNRNFTNDYGGYEASAASVDIMELDSGDQSTSTQFSFQGNQRSLSSINFVNDDSTNYRPDCPNVLTHNERSSTHDLLGYLAAALPTILVARRLCSGIPLLRPDSINNLSEMGEPCGFECRNMSLVVSNYGGTTPLSPAYTLHVLTSSGSSLRQASQNGFSDNYIRDVAAAEARSALSILLYELQEGLVVKLLLPTEPTTPAPPFSISASRRSSKSDNRISYLTVANPQDCWQESRPLLQRFKKLFNFGDVALSSECPVTSPDTVTHAEEEYSPPSQASAYNTFHTAKLFPPSKYTEICGTQFNKNSCVVTVPKVSDGYDDESRVSDSLQPISPICSMEDVTSVQLLLIRIHLDAPLHSQSTSHGAETVENFSVVVTIDYAIKIQGNQETRTQETTNESSWSSTEGDKGDTYTFGCARIVSAPYSRQSTPLGSILPLMPATASSIIEPLGAAITVSQYQQSTGLKPYDAVIQLDYEYLLTELMRIVSCALRRMSYS